MESKKNKKGSATMVVVILLLGILAIGGIGFGIYASVGGFSATGGADDGTAKAEISTISSSLGTDFENDLEKLRLTSDDLNSTVQDLELNITFERNDLLEDLTTSGRRFVVDVEVINGDNGFTSWNDSVTAKQYFITYDSVSDEFDVNINSGTEGDLSDIISISSDSTVQFNFEVATLTTANNIVKTQYASQTIAKITISNEAGEELDSYSVEYFRTTATSS